MSLYLYFVVVLAVLLFGAALVFPEIPRMVDRRLRRILAWPSHGFDGVHLGAGKNHAKLFVVFDPPWWRLRRWVWWVGAVRSGVATGRVAMWMFNPRRAVSVRVFEKPKTYAAVNFRRKHAG